MPVSTRSQFSVVRDEPKQLATAYRHRAVPPLPNQEAVAGTAPPLLRNPHHALKEKMKALTLFYEQHQHQLAGARSAVPRGQRHCIATHHPSVDLLDSDVKKRGGGEEEQAEGETNMAMKENVVNSHELLMTSMGLSKKPAVSHAAAKTKGNIGTVGGDRAFLLPLPGKEEPGVAGTPISQLGGLGTASEPGAMRPKRSGGGSDIGAISENRCGISGTAGGASRIMVYVRLRPLAKKEKEAGWRCCVRIFDRRDVYLTEFASETDYLRMKRLRGRHFSFDASFSESTAQQEVYATTTAELVEGVLQGKNGSVFCYGATGAGKTYTMLGTVENPGVMVLAIKDLFAKIRQRSFDGSHVVHLSYLEVYNETVRDLLSPGRPLVLREDKQGIVAAGLTQYRAYSTDEVMALLQQGNQNRTTEPTRANETSSRSHAILQVVAEHREKVSGGGVVHRVGKLSLIDLAGSERALATEQRTQRSLEGANINRSLLALSSCINALVEGKKHIPYRNSKLTQLLKDSLGGSSCNTVMIANISPGNLSFAETQNTLHWADRAKQIRTKAAAVINEESLQVPQSDDAKLLLLQLQKENGELRRQLAQQKQKLLTLQAQTLAANNSTPAPSPANDGGDANLKMSPVPPSSQRRPPKRSILAAAACFSTPESKKRVANDDVARRRLQDRVKALELELERVKKEHRLQIERKDDFIRELVTMRPPEGGGEERIVTRASLRKAESAAAAAAAQGELKGPRHRFLSPPVPTAKKRSFWDITAANSPSVISINGRKTKSHVAADTTPATKPAAAPSMLLQIPLLMQQLACL